VKTCRSMVAALVAGVLLPATLLPASLQASENRPLKCDIAEARSAAPTGGPALVANVPGAMTPIDLDAVLMDDKGVWKKVVVEGLYARRTPTNTVSVSARLVNCSKQPITIQARSSFLDAAQGPAEPASVWKVIHISPRSIGTYQESSLSTGVANYLIELRSDQ